MLASLRVLFMILVVILPVSVSFATRRERLIDTWKPLHYDVSVTLDEQLKEIINARAEITVLVLQESLSQVDLDFGELAIDAVKVNHAPAAFDRSPGHLNIKLSKAVPRDTRILIMVSYHGAPKDGLILSTDKAGNPSAVGDNWPDRVHHWIPCLDHPSAKATVTFSVTAPARKIVVANGKLERTEQSSADNLTWTYNESVPIPPYCMVIAVGTFALLQAPAEVTPLAYYVPLTDKDFAMQGFAAANPSMKYFSQTIAPYPYEKLALIVGATRFGGMENSSAIVFTSSLFNSRSGNEPISKVFHVREGIVSVVAHEIAHQWFGDSVTESTWADLWLSEGFATYFAGLMIQHYEGEQAFQDYLKRAADQYFNYEKKKSNPIHDTETENLFQLLNANNYQKGAWVLHMLRSSLGDEAFFRGIREYYRSHKNSTATTEDLRGVLEKASGRNLKEFFERWIYGTGHPVYDLSWKWNGKTNRVTLMLKQMQVAPAFLNALPIELITPRGKRRVILNPTGKQTVKEVKLNAAPTSVSIDSGNTVLKELHTTN